MGRFDSLYGRMPDSLQHAAVSAYGAWWWWLRFGPGHARLAAEYEARGRYTTAQWRDWQQAHVRALLRRALDAPYYARCWTPSQKDAALRGRLDELPCLGKDAVRDDPWSFATQGGRLRRTLVFHTSGSTGTPVATLWTVGELRRSMAVREVRSARWAGTSFRFPRATFSGRMIVPDPLSNGPFHRYNAAERQVYFSPFHLRPETAPQYVAALHRHSVEWVTGYAVSCYLLARFVIDQRLQVPPLRAVVTTSEKLSPNMRAVMKEAFGCPVFEEYSTVENVLFASECERGRLHSSPDVGIVEILRPDGTACPPGEPGEVVATCLLRTLQPLIRYRLGDRAVFAADPCPCGRDMPVIEEVLGRVEDVVIGPDGRRMVRFHGLFVDQPHVREGQVIQERLDRIRVRVAASPGFGRADEEEIARRVRQRLGPDVLVVVEPVNEIPRSASGKFQPVISMLREQGVDAAERIGVG